MPTITEFEDIIDNERKSYYSCLDETLELLEKSPTINEAIKQMTKLHNKGSNFFNLFERSIDEYGLSYFELNTDTKNRKIEDSIEIVDVIINHWTTLDLFSTKFSVIKPVPSSSAYSSIQRLIKHFQPNESKNIKDKFMTAKLPTRGFDEKTKFSGWKIGSRNMTITQIIVGLAFIIVTGIILFNKDTLTGMQYFFSRALLSLGVTLIGSALLEGAIKLNWTIQKTLTVKAVGWIALFILLYYFNPPAAPIP